MLEVALLLEAALRLEVAQQPELVRPHLVVLAHRKAIAERVVAQVLGRAYRTTLADRAVEGCFVQTLGAQLAVVPVDLRQVAVEPALLASQIAEAELEFPRTEGTQLRG